MSSLKPLRLANSPLLWTTAALAAGVLAVLRWLALAPLPKRNARERAELAREWWLKYLKVTPHFDQLLKGMQITHMGPEGSATGSISVEGTLLSASGHLHEAGLFDLVDVFGSLCLAAAGHFAGVSLEMSASLVALVRAGEKLTVRAKALRIGRTVAFTEVEVRRTEGELVAFGSHTKHIGQTFLPQLGHKLLARFVPLARWIARRALAQIEALGNSVPKSEAATMEEALGVQMLPPGHESGVQAYAVAQLHLLNGYWAGHGAASAGLLAAAAREHLRKGKDVRFQDILALYLNPVPAFRPVGIAVTELPATGGTKVLVVDLKDERGKVLVRGRLTAALD